jgi:aryl carrier-like protein
VHEDAVDERRLACYYVPTPDAHYDAASLRELVADSLPDYMIPAAWVSLERMPLSLAGKVDRKALPAPRPESGASVFREPETPTEITLAEIWADVLHLERLGLDDDFFTLGGDSIQLFQITARANRSGLPLKAKELLHRPTLGALASYLDEMTARSNNRATGAPTTVARLHPIEATRERVRELVAPEYVERTAW